MSAAKTIPIMTSFLPFGVTVDRDFLSRDMLGLVAGEKRAEIRDFGHLDPSAHRDVLEGIPLELLDRHAFVGRDLGEDAAAAGVVHEARQHGITADVPRPELARAIL